MDETTNTVAAPEAETESTTEQDTARQAQSTDEAGQQEQQDTIPAEPAFELPITFNHKEEKLSRDEAVRLAQIGKLADGKTPLLRAAEKLFKQSGAKDFDEFEATIAAQHEKEEIQKIVASEGVSENSAKELVRLRGIEKQLLEKQISDTETEKTVTELKDLKSAYPDADLNKIPDETVSYAAKYKVPIRVAYENTVVLAKRTAELNALKAAQSNASASIGSVAASSSNTALNAATAEFERQWKLGSRT